MQKILNSFDIKMREVDSQIVLLKNFFAKLKKQKKKIIRQHKENIVNHILNMNNDSWHIMGTVSASFYITLDTYLDDFTIEASRHDITFLLELKKLHTNQYHCTLYFNRAEDLIKFIEVQGCKISKECTDYYINSYDFLDKELKSIADFLKSKV